MSLSPFFFFFFFWEQNCKMVVFSQPNRGKAHSCTRRREGEERPCNLSLSCSWSCCHACVTQCSCSLLLWVCVCVIIYFTLITWRAALHSFLSIRSRPRITHLVFFSPLRNTECSLFLCSQNKSWTLTLRLSLGVGRRQAEHCGSLTPTSLLVLSLFF